MGRAFQVQTMVRPWRSILALPMAALMMISNAITLRAGRAPLAHPEPGNPAADRILAGVPVWQRPAFLGAAVLSAGVIVAIAPGLVL
jgi:hypothetical protein